jgi:hypothetical protein
MELTKNVGLLDRLVRVILSEILFILAFFWLGGYWQILFYFLALAILFTVHFGFCPLYWLLKIDTTKNDTKGIPRKIFVVIFILFTAIAVFGSYFSDVLTQRSFFL